jgi:hypothetical protein
MPMNPGSSISVYVAPDSIEKYAHLPRPPA